MEGESIDCAITSPPYFGLRDYGVRGQIGLERTPAEYIKTMVDIFRDVRRILKPEGTLWLNMGDSYAGSGKGYGDKNEDRKYTSAARARTLKKAVTPGLKPKDMMGIPWRLAFALQEDGWYLRQDIIWHKPNPMPESVKDRCTKAHEYVFLLSKSPTYFFDGEAIKEPAAGRDAPMPMGWGVGDQPRTSKELQKSGVHRKDAQHSKHGGSGKGFKTHSGNTVVLADGTIKTYDERNKRSVWSIGAKPFKEAHFATFPEELIKPMILAGCPQGGVCLDPFMGAGTTALVAKKLDRHFVGIELNPKYIKIAKKRLAPILAQPKLNLCTSTSSHST